MQEINKKCVVCKENIAFKLNSSFRSYSGVCGKCKSVYQIRRNKQKFFSLESLKDEELEKNKSEVKHFFEIDFPMLFKCPCCDKSVWLKKCRERKKNLIERGFTHKKIILFVCYKCHYSIFVNAGYINNTIEEFKYLTVNHSEALMT